MSTEPDACQTEMSSSTQARPKHFKPIESGLFQHRLFAPCLFLCPVVGDEENFQAASARATKRDNVCLCTAGGRAGEERKEIHQNVFCITRLLFSLDTQS